MLKNNHILPSENSVAVNPAAGSSDAAQILRLPLICLNVPGDSRSVSMLSVLNPGCGADQDTDQDSHSVYFIHTLKININIQSWLQVETDFNKWDKVTWFPSASCCLFTLIIYHILCVIALFPGGLFIWGLFLLVFFFTLTNIYFDSLIRFIPPSGFLISGSKQELHSFAGSN